MYAGQFVEESAAADFFRAPLHPYAKLLLASVPLIRQNRRPKHIPGRPPNLFDLPGGCRFAERCPDRFKRCVEDPGMIGLPGGRHVRCQLYWPERTPG
jgi:oligopeptide/dipeptide ABC transporter ATP-binding protein